MSWHHYVVEVAALVHEILATLVELKPEGPMPGEPSRLLKAAAAAIESLHLPDIQRLTSRLRREYLLAARMEVAGRLVPQQSAGGPPADGTRDGRFVWIRGERLDVRGEQTAELFELIVRSAPSTKTIRDTFSWSNRSNLSKRINDLKNAVSAATEGRPFRVTIAYHKSEKVYRHHIADRLPRTTSG